MNGFKKKLFFEKSTPYETVTNAMKSTQNLSPGRFLHAEVESEVKNLPILHPDLEIKENDLQIYFFFSVRRVRNFIGRFSYPYTGANQDQKSGKKTQGAHFLKAFSRKTKGHNKEQLGKNKKIRGLPSYY